MLFLGLSCRADRIHEEHWREKGAEAIMPLKKSLKKALTNALAEGPVEAVGACHSVAPALSQASGSERVAVGRTSHKLRNPDNAPRPWVQPLLQQYLRNPDRMEPKVVALDKRTVGYVEPIYLQPMCVTCHGTDIAPEVAAKIRELYPEDEAVGFEPGHFRGVFWAELRRD